MARMIPNPRIAKPETLRDPGLNGRPPLDLLSDIIHRAGQSAKSLPVPLEVTPSLNKKRSVFGMELASEDVARCGLGGARRGIVKDRCLA